jgi:hypothetical protein
VGRFIDWKCLDCRTDTNDEGYMVHNVLWLQAVEHYEEMRRDKTVVLCIGCLENRIGRRLTPDDFTVCPLNQVDYYRFKKSNRLISRLKGMAPQAD